MSLIKEPTKKAKVNILDFEKFEDTFGKKSQRTRAKLAEFTVEGLANLAEEKETSYNIEKDTN